MNRYRIVTVSGNKHELESAENLRQLHETVRRDGFIFIANGFIKTKHIESVKEI